MRGLATLSLVLAAAPAFAQATDPLKDMKYGDRVDITLRSGFNIIGILTPASPDDRDLSKSRIVILDLSLEFPELVGRKLESGGFSKNLFGFHRHQIKTARKLRELSAEEVAAREKQREAELGRVLAEEAKRRKDVAEREAKEREEAEKRAKEERAKNKLTALDAAKKEYVEAKALADRFSLPEWGPDRLKLIQQKIMNKTTPLPQEQEFVALQAQIAKAREIVANFEKAEEAPKETPAGEKKPEGGKTEEPEKEEPKEEPKSYP